MSVLEATREAFRKGDIAKPAYIEQMHGLHARLYEYAKLLPDTDIARIEITDGRVVMTFRGSGVKMLCDPADQRIAPIETLNFGRYEPKDAEMIYALVRPGDRIFDVGANHGFYALHLAKRFPDAVIDAFEPMPHTHGYLLDNLAANGVTNVRTHRFGLSGQTEDLTFYFYPEGSGNASSANLSERHDVETVTCPVKRMDEHVAETGVMPDFVKCDVEGAELFVFQGGVETLRRGKPVVFTEMLRKWAARFGYHPNAIIELFEGLGYRCFRAEGGRLRSFVRMDESTVETNFFFLHPERSGDAIAALEQV